MPAPILTAIVIALRFAGVKWIRVTVSDVFSTVMVSTSVAAGGDRVPILPPG